MKSLRALLAALKRRPAEKPPKPATAWPDPEPPQDPSKKRESESWKLRNLPFIF